jgi:cytochrome oxidase assembly protein ShyY1
MDYVDILRLQKYEPLPLFAGVLELENQTKGCETFMPSEEMIQKHRSYQYQWYGLAILMGLLYGYYGFRH